MDFMLSDTLPPVTPEAVIFERERRLALGFLFDFKDKRGVHHIGTTPADMKGWEEVTSLATTRKVLDDDTPILVSTDTGPVQLSPTEWLLILSAAGHFRQPIWQASFLLQKQDPIPVDYQNNRYWP